MFFLLTLSPSWDMTKKTVFNYLQLRYWRCQHFYEVALFEFELFVIILFFNFNNKAFFNEKDLDTAGR